MIILSTIKHLKNMSVISLFSKDQPTHHDLLVMSSHKDLTDRAKTIAFELICKNLNKIKTIQDIELKIPTLPNYSCFNPSIVKTKDGYICVIRTSNYKYDDLNRIIFLEKQVNTINYVVKLDHEFKIIEYRILENPLFVVNPPNVSRQIFGCEDFRIRSDYGYLNGNTLEGSYTCCNQFKDVICSIGESSYNLEHNQIITSKVYPSPENRVCEKNWLPFQDKFIYQFNPLTILDSNGKVITTHKNSDLCFSTFRGSCSPIKYGNELLCLVHETIKLKYVHRFVRINSGITHVSTPFTFQGRGIEYCCGMCPSNVDNIIVLTYGLGDAEARLCLVDLNTIEWIKV